jgi:hypothetical protein
MVMRARVRDPMASQRREIPRLVPVVFWVMVDTAFAK